jgi:hypothetical protein
VDTGELSESGINVSALETGVYILEVNDGQKTVAKKSVKINSIIIIEKPHIAVRLFFCAQINHKKYL